MVVLIHLPLGVEHLWTFAIWIAIRKIINFAVPVFFFLSGYYSKNFNEICKIGLKKYYTNRFRRLLIPYFIWASFYVIIWGLKKNEIPSDWLYLLLTGIGPTYFLLALAQLTVLTPIMQWLKCNKVFNYIFWLVTPLYIVFFYLWNFSHCEEFRLGQFFCFPWFVFYYLGIKAQEINCFGHKMEYSQSPTYFLSLRNGISFFIISVILAQIEGFSLNHYTGIFPFSISQITIGSIMCSLACIFLIIRLAFYIPVSLSILSKLGDYSMGIFLLHTAFNQLFIFLFYHLEPIKTYYVHYPLGNTLGNLIIWPCSLILSYLTSKYISINFSKVARIIGLN